MNPIARLHPTHSNPLNFPVLWSWSMCNVFHLPSGLPPHIWHLFPHSKRILSYCSSVRPTRLRRDGNLLRLCLSGYFLLQFRPAFSAFSLFILNHNLYFALRASHFSGVMFLRVTLARHLPQTFSLPDLMPLCLLNEVIGLLSPHRLQIFSIRPILNRASTGVACYRRAWWRWPHLCPPQGAWLCQVP